MAKEEDLIADDFIPKGKFTFSGNDVKDEADKDDSTEIDENYPKRGDNGDNL